MSRKPMLTLVLAAAAAAAVAVIAGCSSKRPPELYPREEIQEFDKVAAQPVYIEQDKYILGTGDRIDVVFLYHNNLTTRDLLIRKDGKISLPYVGDHDAAGLMPMELDSLLTDRFAGERSR